MKLGPSPDGLAVIHGLEHGDEPGVLLHVPGQRVEVAGADVASTEERKGMGRSLVH